MKYIDGIPIYTREEALTETYEHFGLRYGDPQIVIKAIEYLKQIQQQNTTEALRAAVFFHSIERKVIFKKSRNS